MNWIRESRDAQLHIAEESDTYTLTHTPLLCQTGFYCFELIAKREKCLVSQGLYV